MIGFTIDRPAPMLGDNERVVTSLSITNTNLKKKENVIDYHGVNEAAVAGAIILAHIPGKFNQSDDLMTKRLGNQKYYPITKEFLV